MVMEPLAKIYNQIKMLKLTAFAKDLLIMKNKPKCIYFGCWHIRRILI